VAPSGDWTPCAGSFWLREHEGHRFAELAALNHPNTDIAASDSGAHISQILDSNIPAYFLAHWVRDRGAFSWPRAIHMPTGIPASAWGFHDRGSLRVGSVADVVVFDPETFASAVAPRRQRSPGWQRPSRAACCRDPRNDR